MERSSAKRLIVLLAALLLALLPMCCALAEDEYTAQSMRLLHYEGEVEILDANGKPRFVMENVRFKSGEAMRTGEASTASVSLDATKIVTLDQLSLLEFIKQGNHMLLTLKEGTLLLDVQKKLDENESLDVETSTLTVGIRGTMIVLSEQRKEDMTIAKLSVLSGVTQVTYIDEGGARQSFQLPSGSTALLTDKNGNGHADAQPVIRKMEKQDMEGFVDQQLRKNPEMLKRIENENSRPDDMNVESGKEDDYPYSAGGKWQWDGKVSLVARSASKMYDGTPLVRASDVLVEGLPSEFRCSVTATGIQIDAGKSTNPVGDYKIYNSRNEDVTGHFANVEKIDGQLIVEPVPITITTGSAEKIYDGTPLTNPEVSIAIRRSVEPQSVPEEETQAGGVGGGVAAQAAVTRNVSYLVNPSLKNQTLYGVCGVVVVHAMNPLTGEASDVQLKAGYRLIIYLNDEKGQESLKYETEPVALSDLPEELLRIYAENPDALQQACQETGWKEEDVKALIANLKMNTSAKMVEQDGIRIVEDEADRLLMDFTNAHINIDSSITNYNGRALNGQEAEFVTPPIDGEITVTATGTQTDVGESANTYEIKWDKAKEGNYVVSEELGTLTVTPATLTVSTGTAEKVYDGQPLTNSEASITGLVKGEKATVTANGSITRAGNAAITYTINWGTAKRDNYTVSENLGKLTVEPLQLSVDFHGDEVELVDGNPVFPTPVLSYGNGPHAGETVTAVRTRSLNMAYRFSLFTGDQIGLEISTKKKGGGYYELIATPSYPAGLQSSFSVESAGTVYMGGPQTLTISTPSASKTYDGTPLTSTDVTVEGLDESDTIQVTATGTQTDAGFSTNAYSIDWGDTNAGDYTIVEELGTLTVEPKPVTVTTGSASKPYDGTALTCANPAPAISGLISGEGAKVTATGTITGVGTANNTYSIEWNAGTKAGNYTITENLGTLTVSPAQVSITTKSYSKQYDGQPLTYWKLESNYTAVQAENVYTITLKNGEWITATITGSQTDVGQGSNTCDIAWSGAASENYEVSLTTGTLTVSKNTSEVVLTAVSASKEYDGTPLTAAAAGGQPEGFTVVPTMSAASTQTEVGTCDNVIVSHKIYKGEQDVTANFTNVKYAKGTLMVKSTENLTITAAAKKTYDGTPLTATAANTTVTIEPALSGYTAEVTMTGSLTDAGSTDAEVTSFTIRKGGKDVTALYPYATASGVLTVTPKAVTITTGSASKPYDGTPLTKDELYVNGTLLTKEGTGYKYSLIGTDYITASVTGAVTDATAEPVDNTCEWAMGSGNADNYEVTVTPGTLTVSKYPVKITTGSATKEFDGQALSSDVVKVNDVSLSPGETGYKCSLAGGDVLTIYPMEQIGATAQAVNNACTYALDTANTGNYEITEDFGTLHVTQRIVTLELDGLNQNIVYDGAYHGDGLAVHADGITVDCSASGDGCWTLTMPWDDTMNVRISNGGTDAGDYELFCVWEATSGSINNYSVSSVGGNMKIKPAGLAIVSDSAEKEYDGTPLTCFVLSSNYPCVQDEEESDVFTVTLENGETITVTVTGSQTDKGGSKNNFDIAWGAVNQNNYRTTTSYGDLNVTANHTYITITAPSYEETYNGWPHNLDTDQPWATNVPDGFWVDACKDDSVAPVDVTVAPIAVVDYSFSIFNGEYWEDVPAGYFDNVETVDGYLTIKPRELTLTAESDEMYYCGVAYSREASFGGDFAEDEGADVYITCDKTGVGEWDLSYTTAWYENTKPSNYHITATLGKLKILPIKVIVYVSGVYQYDGNAHDGANYVEAYVDEGPEYTITAEKTGASTWRLTVNELGDSFTLTATGGGTEEGTYPLTCTISGEGSNYEVTIDSSEGVFIGNPFE
ncbi:MAG: FecR domain-containing protein [Clostridia bacterium]|nr:FecR domain-containing protein [Clostridia bacterium]